MSEVLVRYYAAVRHAVGITEEMMVTRTGLEGILDQLSGRSDEISTLVGRCVFLADGCHIAPNNQPLPEGCTVDILPPFAGG